VSHVVATTNEIFQLLKDGDTTGESAVVLCFRLILMTELGSAQVETMSHVQVMIKGILQMLKNAEATCEFCEGMRMCRMFDDRMIRGSSDGRRDPGRT
jgi:hypothetical protein